MGSKMTVAEAWSAPYVSATPCRARSRSAQRARARTRSSPLSSMEQAGSAPALRAPLLSPRRQVEEGSMSQRGFSELCGRIGIEEMSFEACYLMYLLVPDVEDVMTVCRSQSALQKAVEGLGCRLVSDCPQKLRSKKAAMVASFDMHSFQPFFRWMFDMGKSISAMNTGAHVGVVRSVPVQVSEVRPHPLQKSPGGDQPASHRRRRLRRADGAAVDGGRPQRLGPDGQVQGVLLDQGPRALQQGPVDADRPLRPPGVPVP